MMSAWFTGEERADVQHLEDLLLRETFDGDAVEFLLSTRLWKALDLPGRWARTGLGILLAVQKGDASAALSRSTRLLQIEDELLG
jgi:hypothetical protein